MVSSLRMSDENPRKGVVYFKDTPAGVIEGTDTGFSFTYDPAYLQSGVPISHSLPLQAEPFIADRLFPFFRGLLPEGWYLEIVSKTLKIDEHDELGMLLGTCADCIGAVSVRRA